MLQHLRKNLELKYYLMTINNNNNNPEAKINLIFFRYNIIITR